MIIKILGGSLIALSFISIILALVDPVATVIVLLVLVVSGFTALSGDIKYALLVLMLTTIFILHLSLSLLGVFSSSYTLAPLPEGIPKINELSPVDLPDTNEVAIEISKESGIPYEKIISKKPEIIVHNPMPKNRQVLMLLKFISIPYLTAVILILMGYYTKVKSREENT